jgi:hypothetical protein
MAEPVTLQKRWRRMVRDLPREDLPKDSAWNLVDYVPDLGAAVRKRGGWANASADISATVAAASYIIAGGVLEYEAATKHVVVSEDGRFIEVTSDSSTTDIAAGIVVAQNPVLHRDIAIFSACGGATNPKSVKYTGSYTVADLAGSPPQAKWATTYKDRTVLACSTAEPQRVWFSDPGDPEGWDTTNTYWDFSRPITGIASLTNALLIFHTGYTSRLYGDTPPPGTNFVADDPKFAVGCIDARSIAYYGGKVVFASAEGIYVTDGIDYEDVTARSRMLSYWQELMAAYAASTWTVVGSVIRGYYMYCVMDGTTFKDAGMVDLTDYQWMRHSNVDAACMYTSQGAADELYFGRRGAARVGKVSTFFMPSSTYKNDGDGDAVAPILESPYYKPDAFGLADFQYVLFGYDTRDAASDNPTLTISYITSPESTSYTAVTGLDGNAYPLPETTAYTTATRRIFKSSRGIGFKIAQTNASSDTRGYELAVIAGQREGHRV